jgi:hypothetical protein
VPISADNNVWEMRADHAFMSPLMSRGDFAASNVKVKWSKFATPTLDQDFICGCETENGTRIGSLNSG